jgi:putative peptidoglycan lipid II flippase
MGSGVISHFFWADRLLELPLSLVASSLGIVLVAQGSLDHGSLSSRTDCDPVSSAADRAFAINGLLVLPSAVGLFVLARPIVDVLFFHGNFGVLEARHLQLVLQYNSVFLILAATSRVAAAELVGRWGIRRLAGWALAGLALQLVLAFGVTDEFELLTVTLFGAGFYLLVLTFGMGLNLFLTRAFAVSVGASLALGFVGLKVANSVTTPGLLVLTLTGLGVGYLGLCLLLRHPLLLEAWLFIRRRLRIFSGGGAL